MYNYDWDVETGGYVLNAKLTGVTKEVRPVYCEELKLLELDKNYGWKIPTCDEPLMWTEGRRYIYRGEMVAEAVGGGLYSLPVMKNTVRNLELIPVDVEAMVAKNENLMNGLVQKTLKDIYKFYDEYRNKTDLFYAAFSGGKDSAVMLDLVQRALPHDAFVVIFGDTTMELSDTYKNVEESKKFWRDLKWYTARAEFDALDSWKFAGPPARTIRWCCGVHKSAPSVIKTKEILAEMRGCAVNEIKHFKVAAFLGVRSEESEARSGYEKVAEGNKHRVQINCNAILDWSSCELFVYLFEQKIPLNRAYINGLHRVGCKLCPMASSWTDCIQNHVYRNELAPFIDIIRNSINKQFKTEEAWQQYLSDGGWKKRAGGAILKNGESRLTIVSGSDKERIIIKNAVKHWDSWLPTLGILVETSPYVYEIEHRNVSLKFTVDEKSDVTVLSYRPLEKNRDTIRFMYLFKNALTKSAYCESCGECMVECPHSALSITNAEIKFNNCLHCETCLDMQKGCIVARSLMAGGNNVNVKNIDRYRTFGLKQEWVEIYFENPSDFWENTRLGKDMFTAFDRWGKEALLFDEKRTPSPYLNRFIELGADNPKLWGYIFANLTYNSPIITWYIRNCEFGRTYTSDSMMIMLGDELTDRTKRNALSSLKNTIKSSPIGWLLGQGECEMKGKVVTSITRTGWAEPDALVILYTLYLFAEHNDDFYSFTLSELADDDDEREAMSPNLIFGIDSETLRPILQGLAHDYADFIQVDFNNNLLENVFLNREKTSADAAALL